MLFWLLFPLVIFQRVIELWLARRNQRWVLGQGGYEVGHAHYKYLVGLHVFFFIGLLVEVHYFGVKPAAWWYVPFTLFVLVQLLRVWCITSLGPYWNTRIMIIPGAKVVKKGPYRYLRHPNYMIVVIEILLLPLIFQAYGTAILFSILNALVLSIRIPYEERALHEATNYGEEFEQLSRFIPQK